MQGEYAEWKPTRCRPIGDSRRPFEFDMLQSRYAHQTRAPFAATSAAFFLEASVG
jgi:hypothetical protein